LVGDPIIAVWGMSTGAAGMIGIVTVVTSSFGGWFAGTLADRLGRVRGYNAHRPESLARYRACRRHRQDLQIFP
jgi:MFS family permease